MSETLENWLDDHPGKTADDFADISARSAALGSLTVSEAQNFVTRGSRAGLDILHFQTWEVMQEFVAGGYLVRLGGGKYQRTEKRGPSPKVPKQGPERLPNEDDAAYWKRFWRWNQERIEELEREERRKEPGQAHGSIAKSWDTFTASGKSVTEWENKQSDDSSRFKRNL